MKLTEGLYKARSHLIFLAALLLGVFAVYELEQLRLPDATSAVAHEAVRAPDSLTPPAIPAPAPLTTEERAWAIAAWKYFENNYQPATGLVNSVDNYTATTMWDTGSWLLALESALRLGLIDSATFNTRLGQALATLARLPLVHNALPNKSYNTTTLAMTDYANNPAPEGIGWSALDIGRLLVPLSHIARHYPGHTQAVQQVIGRWNFDLALHRDALSTGGVHAVDRLQEGRLGYEEYAAKAYMLFGLGAVEALRYDRNVRFVEVAGVFVPTDDRKEQGKGGINYVTSEPYLLSGLEFGWDMFSRDYAYRVYLAQQQRFAATDTLTAVSEDHVDRPPYFVYNTVYSGNGPWRCIATDGREFPELRSLSTKAVFGWFALYRTDYTQKLMEAIRPLYDAQRGWYTGRYEANGLKNASITCNTNALVLEALCYKAFGPLLHPGRSSSTL